MAIFSGFSSLLTGSYLDLFLQGIALTAQLFVVSLIAALLLGCILMMIRLTPGRIGDSLVTVYVEYHRNVPSLVQLFVWYFGVPQLLPQPVQDWINMHGGEVFFAIVSLTLNAAAYISEDLRSGFRSLPSGQTEAARALGINYFQTLRKILIPQAVRAAAPALVNQTLGLFKTTALAMAIGTAEVMYMTRQIEGETYMTFQTYAVASIIYLIGSWTIMALGGIWQRRIQIQGSR